MGGELKQKRRWACHVCSSGKGSGGLLFQFDEDWSGWCLEDPEECPQCGSAWVVQEDPKPAPLTGREP